MRVLIGPSVSGDPRGAVLTIGVYDGVHRGHQEVLAQVVSEARRRDCAATVVTFDPHPAMVLNPDHAPAQIETLERRLDRFDRLGIDQVRVINFDADAARQSAQDFVERVLVGELLARHVMVGEDFRFGRERGGDAEKLTAWGAAQGFGVSTVAPVGDGQRFSSTLARSMIQRGDLIQAERVLGHHFVIDATVVHGDARGGRDLGYPTANLEHRSTFVQPGIGIYAGAARTEDRQWFAAAISVGRRPQFYDHADVLIEAHLVGCDADLYGQQLTLVVLGFLRGEAKFGSVNDLIAQMARDVATTEELFKDYSGNPESLLGFPTGQRR